MYLQPSEQLESIGGGHRIIVSMDHTFNTDTVLLASYAMPKRGEQCAEFGTGCGMISLLWCSRSAPKAVYALEIQSQACSQAERSAALNGFTQMHVLEYDLRRLIQEPAKELPIPINLDLIACNPPYKPLGTGIQNPQKSKAASRHEIGCTLEQIAAAAARLLRWGGRFTCCLRPERMSEAFRIFSAAGLEPKKCGSCSIGLKKRHPCFCWKPGVEENPACLLNPCFYWRTAPALVLQK